MGAEGRHEYVLGWSARPYLHVSHALSPVPVPRPFFPNGTCFLAECERLARGRERGDRGSQRQGRHIKEPVGSEWGQPCTCSFRWRPPGRTSPEKRSRMSAFSSTGPNPFCGAVTSSHRAVSYFFPFRSRRRTFETERPTYWLCQGRSPRQRKLLTTGSEPRDRRRPCGPPPDKTSPASWP